jgi:hypothetical protein
MQAGGGRTGRAVLQVNAMIGVSTPKVELVVLTDVSQAR